MNLNCKPRSSKSQFLYESSIIINEIKLNVGNSVETTGDIFNGTFNVGESTYRYIIDKLQSVIVEKNFKLEGDIYNISFLDSTDDADDPESYQRKKGYANIVKIYSTMYKIIVDFAKQIKPDYFILISSKKSKYFPIYSELTQNNPIQGYHRKVVSDFPNSSSNPVMGIVMAKNENQKIKEQFEKNLKNLSK